MGAAGRKRVQQLFTWDRSVARLQELYAGILGGVAPAPGVRRSGNRGLVSS
ncbi:MAG: hypothetical protein WBW93_09385 [Steroidobacteraceae bacterium]